jgi:PAS domain S-box-containing protein
MYAARPSPIGDPDRIAAVQRTALVGAPPHPSLERLTRLGARLVGAPTIRVTLVDDHQEFVVGGTGLREPLASARSAPLSDSLCRHIVDTGTPLVIGDARRSSRLRGHPAVLERGERAYAGFPVRDALGHVLGAFSAVDYLPHRWTDSELDGLQELAAAAGEEMDHRLLLQGREEDEVPSESTTDMRFGAGPFRGLVEQSLVGIYVVQGGRFRYVNPRFAEIFGCTPEEIRLLATPLDLVEEADRERVVGDFEQLGGDLRSVHHCVRGRRRDGTPIHLEVQGILADFDGSPAVVGTLLDVTERICAEAALRESEERYRRFFEDGLAGAWTAEVGGAILDCNPAFLRIFGFESAEQARASSIVDLYLVPEDRAGVLERLREKRVLELNEMDLRRRDGTPIHVIENVVGVFDADGELVQIRGYLLDISEREQAVEALRQSEERTRAILEMAHDAFVAIDAEGAITDWNVQAELTFGWSRAEAVGRPLATLLIPPRYRQAHLAGMQRFLATGKGRVLNQRFQMPALHRDGREFPMELTITGIRLGESYIFTSFLHDITEQQKAETALRESEERLRLVERATNDVIWDWDLVSGELVWNGAGAKRFRYASAEVGTSVEWHAERVHPEDREEVIGGIYQAMGGVDDSWSEEYRFLRGDGTYATVLDRAYLVRNERGEPTRMIGSMMDVTERKRVEDTQRFLARASTLMDASLDAEVTLNSLARLCIPTLADYCLIDLAAEGGEVRRVARAHADPVREKLLLTDEHHGPDADPERHPVLKVIRTGQPVLVSEVNDFVLRTIGHSAEHRRGLRELGLCSYMIVPVVARERVLGAITFAAAESKRRYQPMDLMVAEDLAHRAALCIDNAQLYEKTRRAVQARDEVLGVVSHDLRNPLSTIVSAATLLLNADEERREGARKWLDVIRRSAVRMNGMIGDLLDVSSIEAGRFSVARAPHDIAALLEEAREDLDPLARAKQIRLECRAADAGPVIWLDANQILRVLSNLVGNAIKFTPEGGSITVCAEAVGEAIHVSVADTGPGIPAEQIPRVFDRFWQAAEGDRRGAGLGLAIARGIVEAHGGRIWVESTSAGSVFHFNIPWITPAGEDAAFGGADPPPRRGAEDRVSRLLLHRPPSAALSAVPRPGHGE